MVLGRSTRLLASASMALTASVTAGVDDAPAVPNPAVHSKVQLANAEAPVGMFTVDGRMLRLYGPAFSHGATPEASVDAFLVANADFLGVARGSA